MKRIVILVQARMGSTRLPGKILKPILGKTLLERFLERVSICELASEVAVITSTSPEDERLEDLCRISGYTCFRGSQHDLLDRHYKAAKQLQADAILKIPSDVPLIDPKIIDRGIKVFLDSQPIDFVSNLHPATYPDGNDVEIMSLDALERAWREASKPYEREHTTPYFWNTEGIFQIANFTMDDKGTNLSMSHRWTIDYQEDYEFIKNVYEELYPKNSCFTLEDILDLLDAKPEIMQINAKYAGVNWYRHHLDDLSTISSNQTKIIDE